MSEEVTEEAPKLSRKEQLKKEVDEYNQLHNQTEAGKEQIRSMEVELQRRAGRISLLQELVQEEEG